jgi:prepilin-type N-terminal cleavage/methylation domain-containing protein
MNFSTGKKGFTLIEVFVAMAAAAILILTAGTLLFAAIRAWRANNIYVRMRRDAVFALEIMARDIRQAEHDGMVTITSDSLGVYNKVADYNALFSLGGDGTLSYSRDGAVLTPKLATNVADLHAQIGSNEGIELRLAMKNDSLDISFTNETFVYIRNPRPK